MYGYLICNWVNIQRTLLLTTDFNMVEIKNNFTRKALFFICSVVNGKVTQSCNYTKILVIL